VKSPGPLCVFIQDGRTTWGHSEAISFGRNGSRGHSLSTIYTLLGRIAHRQSDAPLPIFAVAEETPMSALEERSNRLLRLAIKNFERAELADSPAVAAQFRAMGCQYRDMAILMLERAAPAARVVEQQPDADEQRGHLASGLRPADRRGVHAVRPRDVGAGARRRRGD
jgi:hypothetical protein